MGLATECMRRNDFNMAEVLKTNAAQCISAYANVQGKRIGRLIESTGTGKDNSEVNQTYTTRNARNAFTKRCYSPLGEHETLTRWFDNCREK
jgi:hypothetical protein